jgi:hypothetical protein
MFECAAKRLVGAQQRPVRREDRDRIGQRVKSIERMHGGGLAHGPIKRRRG